MIRKNKTGLNVGIGIVFAFLLIFSSVFVYSMVVNITFLETTNDFNADNKNLRLSKISGPIGITSNLGWANAKSIGICTGEGTYSLPYVIEDLVIDGGCSGQCIWISHSNVYFKIENCTLYNAGEGIYLYYVNNGTLIGNNCSNNFYGIHTGFSDNITILGNIASDNSNSGIFLDNSTNHIVSGNNCSRNVEIGLYIQKSTNNTLSENYVTDNGFANGWDDTAKNQWDNGMIGNYWSDYSGKDANDDGIGDTPYTILGLETAKDNYPIWWDPPILSIISPIMNETFGKSAPEYSLSVEGVPYTMWCEIEGISGNLPITNLTGTINQDAWNNLTEGDITITFYVQDSRGETDSESTVVTKSIPSGIPGYCVFFLLGILSVVAIIITKKIKKV